ncbi:hypothetical protein LRB11_16045 [Ectothiorhodospira haloalkaliphila]|uniref:hypothetical protein n=1 Tax=Ectothiorhodospira haloalkaliphila TaxID=421628 RepID=UPI001EE940CB|nr:hypothetical protein [Ectothiorhodospira haloalkaliphila]MCG5526418.1 hypothetical protein [Ectothiorhodospira haloalkaliphila]
MRKKLIGEYGIFESSVAIFSFGFFCYLNYLFFKGVYDGGVVTEEIYFMIVFINLIGLVVVSLPFLTRKAEGVSNEKVRIFLDLPDKDSKFTFSAISGFLGDQALAAFLMSLLIFTGKQVFESFGVVIAAFYVVALFVAAIVLGCLSLIRFITHFAKHHGAFYALAAILSTGVMFAFLNAGLRMAA